MKSNRYTYPKIENPIITSVKPIPKVYSAKLTNLFTFISSKSSNFNSKDALEFAETEFTNNIKEIINKKVTVTIPLVGGTCHINARIVKTAAIIVVLRIIQSLTFKIVDLLFSSILFPMNVVYINLSFEIIIIKFLFFFKN